MKKFQRLKDLREDKDMTQEQIAKIFYMHPTQYRRYENSEGTAFTDFLIKIADYYNVSLDYIAGRTNNKAGIGTIKTELSAEEKKLIEDYRQMSERGKIRIQERAESILEDEAEESAATHGRKSS